MARRKTKKYIWAVGRRKKAVATVRLFEGKGQSTVNAKAITEYFPGKVAKITYQKPFIEGDCLGKFWGRFFVRGSGKVSQLEAVCLVLARALVKYNPDVYKTLMRKAGLLTIDSRVRERRKAGQMGRARKKKQSPKR